MRNFDLLKKYEFGSKSAIKSVQERALKKILKHAHASVPYYTKVLEEAEVVKNNNIFLRNFSRIPVLTKDILKLNFEELKSRDIHKRKAFLNSSGGSSGEPIVFFHDKSFQDWMVAIKFYYCSVAGKDIGEKELRLWGSERDLMEGKENLSIRLRNRLYNRKELNAFRMSKSNMEVFVREINTYKPKLIEAYVQPIYELAVFLKRRGLEVHSPAGIITSAGTLYPEMEMLIEEVFKCKVFNRYGSREVGDVAMTCECKEGLHLVPLVHYIEVQNSKVLITNLKNFSMPLIRYEIGDIASMSDRKCACGRSFSMLKKVEGREMSVFRNRRGKIIPAEFFIHLIGVVYNRGFISKFQVIQENYDLIKIKIVLIDKKAFDENKAMIVGSIKKIMGNDCIIEFEFVNDIPHLDSGKYLYTISRLQDKDP